MLITRKLTTSDLLFAGTVKLVVPGAMAAAAEPCATLPEEILEKILLQIPSPASLVRAAFVSKHWGRIISSAGFLGRYRKLHPLSPLLGFYSSDREFGLPAFRINALVRDDHVLKAAHPSPLSAHNGFFGSGHFSKANAFLEQHGRPPIDWRLPDIA